MTAYAAPIDDIRFALTELAGLDGIAALPGYEDATPELVGAVLEEAGKLAAEVIAPLNKPGDEQGSRLENGVVRTPDGFREAYAAYVAGGWNALPFDPEHGGQGLPRLVATAVNELWQSANMAFALCPMLTQAAVDLLTEYGTPEQKAAFLPKLVTGEWAGTMDLTEPQAGSDLGAVRMRAVREGGHYRLKGQKIFITYGDHDLTANIVHVVLARTPDSPPGTKGLSVFIVPKVLVAADGSLGERNDLRCISLEHKLGINASPTAVMAYGEGEGAIGYLVGEENRGIECMFTMMNISRISIGAQGLAIAERAYQQARAFAAERVQGRRGGAAVTIIHHPDVRRMLLLMKSQIEASRGLVYYTAAGLDRAARHPETGERARSQAMVELLTPVVKAWCSDVGVEIASLGVQVHGGMGYIEETGAAQHYRDARINPIYEGANGIQAGDLVRRKVAGDGGAAARAFIAEMAAADAGLAQSNDADLAAIRGALRGGLEALGRATDWVVETTAHDPDLVAAGATPYLRLFGDVAGGWQMARSGLAARRRLANGDGDAGFYRARLACARFYADQVLSQAPGLAHTVTRGGASVMALSAEQF
ncbi:MAG: acyl-CoA dehydrogenase [Proteobacteria bacterium]|nr:acyl-CoA dehydrogenase [Pseudomonadota bacterium]